MTDSVGRIAEGRGTILLWALLLAGPLVWLTQLEVSYVLAHWVCRTGRWGVIPLVALVAVALLVAGGAKAWRLRRAWAEHLRRREPDHPPLRAMPEAEGEVSTRFDEAIGGRVLIMLDGAVAGAAFFVLAAILTAMPGFMLGGCP